MAEKASEVILQLDLDEFSLKWSKCVVGNEHTLHHRHICEVVGTIKLVKM